MKTAYPFPSRSSGAMDQTVSGGTPSSDGFTLVELLVAMAVLAMFVVLMAQLLESASQASRSSGKRTDADSQARMVFDRMAGDLSRMVRRPDADCLFYKNTNNASDVMYFYSEGPAYYTNTAPATNRGTVSLVGYRVATNAMYTNNPVLERLGKGLLWSDAASTNIPIFLTTPSGSAIPTNPSTLAGNWASLLGTAAGGYTNTSDPSSFQTLGDLVCRMEIQFLLTDGTVSDRPILSNAPGNWPTGPTFFNATTSDPATTSATPTYTTGSRWWNSSTQRGYLCTSAASNAAVWSPIGTRDVTALVVTLAILDATSRKIIPAGTAINGTALADSSSTSPVAGSWMSTVTNSSFAGSLGIPRAAASQVRIFQRTFPLQ